MYKDVGKELKKIAKLILVSYMIIFAIAGAVIAGLFLEGDAVFTLLFFGALAGLIVGHFTALRLYAFGELVDRVVSIERQVSGKCDGNASGYEKAPVSSSPTPAGQQAVQANSSGVRPAAPASFWWTCSKCGCENAPNTVECQNCFTRR